MKRTAGKSIVGAGFKPARLRRGFQPRPYRPVLQEEPLGEKLKSAWEIALDKTDKVGGESVRRLTAAQKEEIAQIRKVFEAKVAEVEILIQDQEKKDIELDRLRRERDRKIEAVYEKGKS